MRRTHAIFVGVLSGVLLGSLAPPTARAQTSTPLSAHVTFSDASHHTQRQPAVDAQRIAVTGWSHGGTTVLTAFNRLLVEVTDLPRNTFRAAVAWYPFCLGSGFTPPLLILIGEQEDWTPAAACRQMLKDLEPDTAPHTPQGVSGRVSQF